MGIYDGRLDEPWEDAPLHCECGVCWAPLTSVFEEYRGTCNRCEALDRREAEEQAEYEAELKGAA